MPVAMTRAKYPGNMPARRDGGSRGAAGVSISGSVGARTEIEVQDPEVQGEAGEARQGRRYDDRVVAAEVGLHRRREQPELQHDEHEHDDEDPGGDREPLGADEARRRRAHSTPSSMPNAK